MTDLRVPESLEEVLTPGWLTAALQPSYPGVRVAAVIPGPVISRVATNARFRIECAGERPDGLPADLCVKGYFGESGRAYRDAGIPEALFYRDVVGSTGMRTLRSLYADSTRRPGGVVLTEDVVAAGRDASSTPAATTPPTRRPRAWKSLPCCMRRRGAVRRTPMPPGSSRAWRSTWSIAASPTSGQFRRPDRSRRAGEVRDARSARRRLPQPCRADPERSRPGRVIHGDAHIGNVFLDGTRAAVVPRLAAGAARAVVSRRRLPPGLRAHHRRPPPHERDLVRHYLDQLAAAGVAAAAVGRGLGGIRRGIMHGFFLWAITLKVDPGRDLDLARPASVRGRRRPRRVCCRRRRPNGTVKRAANKGVPHDLDRGPLAPAPADQGRLARHGVGALRA